MLYIPEEVKDILKRDSVKKNLRVSFPNGERADITNENIMAESMSFTESICSRDDFRIGLTEVPTIEFDTFGVDNIKGMEIDVSLEIDITDANYVTKNVKIVDGKGSFQVQAVDDITVDNLNADIDAYYVSDYAKVEAFTIVNEESGTQTLSFIEIDRPIIGEMIEVVITLENVSEVTVHYPVGNVREDLPYPYYSIPIGRFIVEDCPRDAKLRQKRQVSAIGKGYDFERVSLLERAKQTYLTGKEYAFDIPQYAAQNIGLLDESTVYWQKESTTTETISTVSLQQGYSSNQKTVSVFIDYAVHTVSYERDLYKVTNKATAFDRQKLLDSVFAFVDENLDYYNMFGGVVERFTEEVVNSLYPKIVSEKLGEIVLTDNTEYVYPFISFDETDIFTIKVPKKITFKASNLTGYIASEDYAEFDGTIESSSVDMGVNFNLYTIKEYNGESIDFRSIFESYLELLGKFGKHDRKGKFTYHSINNFFGLYPHETLFPSDALHPAESGAILERQDFIEMWVDDYQMLPYGKVTAKYKSGETIKELTVKIPSGYAYYEPTEIGNYSISSNTVNASVDSSLITGNAIYIESDMAIKRVDFTFGNRRESVDCQEKQTSVEWVGNLSGLSSISVILQSASSYSGNLSISWFSRSEIYYSPTESREYRIEDNVLLQTQDYEEYEVEEMLKSVASGIKDVVYVPTTISAKGMPYVEAGDSIWVDDSELGLQTIVMRRTLSGIQALIDDIESKG